MNGILRGVWEPQEALGTPWKGLGVPQEALRTSKAWVGTPLRGGLRSQKGGIGGPVGV